MTDLKAKIENLKAKIQHGLIVSCQAPAGSPLAKPEIIAAFALAAEQNGAVAVRIDAPENIRAVKELVKIPVLGIYKIVRSESEVYITPDFAAAREIARAGADLIATDATFRRRPEAAETCAEIVEKIQRELNLPVMADVATFAEGWQAAEIGCDFVGTTLSGYTVETADKLNAPDFELVEKLAAAVKIPVICEGRLKSPRDVQQAFERGAFSVVVGGAITGIDNLVREFASAARKANRQVF